MRLIYSQAILYFLSLILILPTFAIAQQQLELLIDPMNIEWNGRNLGQGNFTEIPNAKEVAGLWYFNAYDEANGHAIWQTDLSPDGTKIFVDIPTHSLFWMLGAFENWLIYCYTDENGNYINVALNVKTKEQVKIANEGGLETYRGRGLTFLNQYAIICHQGSIYIQDLSQLPESAIIKIEDPSTECGSIYQLDDNRFIKTSGSPTGVPVVVDIAEQSAVLLSDLIEQPVGRFLKIQQYEDRLYFQVRSSMFGEFRLYESDLAFSPASLRLLHTREGNFLMVEDGLIYYSDATGFNNTLDIYRLPEATLEQSINLPFFNSLRWNSMQKVRENGYLLLSDNDRYFYYFDADTKQLTHLALPAVANNATTERFISKEGFLYYVWDGFRNYCWYFSFDDLDRVEVFNTVARQPERLHILAQLPENGLVLLPHSDSIGAEYAVADLNKNSFYYLKDICTNNFGEDKKITFIQPTDDKNILFALHNGIRTELFLYDHELQKTANLSSYYDGPGLKANRYFYNDDIETSPYHILYAHTAESATEIFFRALEQYDAEYYLYRFNKASKQITRSAVLQANDRLLLSPDGQLLIFRLKNLQPSGNSYDEVLMLEGDVLVSIFKSDPNHCTERQSRFNSVNFYKDYFLFSSDEMLYSFHLGTKTLEKLVDNLVQSYTDCKQNIVGFQNFVVVNNEIYFTESRQGIFDFWGIEVLTGPQAFSFWKTNGTAAGTLKLPAFDLDSFSFSAITDFQTFVYQSEIYLIARKDNQNSHSISKWTGSTWQELQTFVDGEAVDNFELSVLRNKDAASIYLEDMPFQLLDRPFDSKTHIRVKGFGNDGAVKLCELVLDGAARFSTVFEVEGLVEQTDPYFYQSLYQTHLLNQQWLLPFYISSDSLESVLELNAFSLTKEIEISIVKKGEVFINQFFYIVPSKDGQLAYINLSSDNDYDQSRSLLYTLAACSSIPDPLSLNAGDTACANGFLRLQVSGATAFERMLVDVSGVALNPDFSLDPQTKDWLLDLNLSPGEYLFSFVYDDDCDLIPLLSKTIVIVEDKPEVSVEGTYTGEGAIYTYAVDSGTFTNYLWQISGGIIVNGQGTPNVVVDWGGSSSGELSLVVEQYGCESEPFIINYVFTGTKDSPAFHAQIFPNPAKDVLYVRVNDLQQDATLSLHNVSGQLLKSELMTTFQYSMPINELPAGIYLLTLQDQSRMQTYKVVVH